MESKDTTKAKKISHITLVIYIIFMFLASILMFLFWGITLFEINGYIMTKNVILSETFNIIVIDTLILYGIPIITCLVQFFMNRVYFFIQLGIIFVYWILTNSTILFICILEIINH